MRKLMKIAVLWQLAWCVSCASPPPVPPHISMVCILGDDGLLCDGDSGAHSQTFKASENMICVQPMDWESVTQRLHRD